MRLAFIGFRHGHVMGLYNAARDRGDIEIVAACEEDRATADDLRKTGTVQLTHARFSDILGGVDCDAVAVGDYFGKRGELVCRALEAGKHVIADKPICTRLQELTRIESLAASRARAVGCLLDLRDDGALRTMRRLVRDGAIGEVHTVNFAAQHPLMLGRRPAWYFEPGAHGGTINDIGVHAFDLIPWMTGRQLVEVVAARAWNARLPQHPHFQDAAQMMLRMDNGGGVLGDLSYLSPDALAYSAPQYWRITCHGADGMLESRYGADHVALAAGEDKAVRLIPSEKATPGGVLDAFVREVRGQAARDALTTQTVLDVSRIALLAQRAADEQLARYSLADAPT